MNYIKQFDVAGSPVRQRPSLTGNGAPTTSTEGTIGELYLDSLSGKMYKCVAVSGSTYTWVRNLDVDDLEESKYELIETITLTEPMSIQRSQEPDGTPYKFRGLRVFVISNANEQAFLNFYLYNSKKSGHAQGTLGSISAGNTVTKYAYAQMENAHGLWQDSWYTFGDNLGASSTFANSYRTMALNTDFSKYDYVASILSSTAVAAGTTIEIWGWRL